MILDALHTHQTPCLQAYVEALVLDAIFWFVEHVKLVLCWLHCSFVSVSNCCRQLDPLLYSVGQDRMYVGVKENC